jgi:hypothetical protein
VRPKRNIFNGLLTDDHQIKTVESESECRRDGKHNYYRVESKLLRDLELGLKLVSAPR